MTFLQDYMDGAVDRGAMLTYMRRWQAEGNGPGYGTVGLREYLGFDEQQWLRYLDRDELPERGAP